jgi:DNA repair exonuclease SbcCD nuclease subunit
MRLNTNEVMIFTDFHWGKGKNSEVKIKQNEKFIDWMIKQAMLDGIRFVIFMGDWFESRNTISVKTYNHSYDALRKLSDAGLAVYMIIGNHDIYFRETNTVNSLRPYSEIPNINIIENAESIEFINGLQAGLVPWDTFSYDTMKDCNWEVMFGHFEFIGAKHNAVGNDVSKHGFNGNEMTQVAPLVFSGHYHARREYDFKYGKVVCIGCPLQLDWGDYNDSKGVYIFNATTKTYKFIENKVNATHHKVFWSKVKNKDQSDLVNVEGNYISLIVDDEYKFESVMRVMNVINRLNPIKNCEVKYEYSKRFNFFDKVCGTEDRGVIQKTKYEHLVDFVDKIDGEDMGSMEKNTVLSLCENYYNEAILKVSDE